MLLCIDMFRPLYNTCVCCMQVVMDWYVCVSSMSIHYLMEFRVLLLIFRKIQCDTIQQANTSVTSSESSHADLYLWWFNVKNCFVCLKLDSAQISYEFYWMWVGDTAAAPFSRWPAKTNSCHASALLQNLKGKSANTCPAVAMRALCPSFRFSENWEQIKICLTLKVPVRGWQERLSVSSTACVL